MDLVANKVSSDPRVRLAPVALVGRVVVVPQEHRAPKVFKELKATRAPQGLVLVARLARWVAKESEESLAKTAPRVMLVHQVHRVLVARMGSKVTVVTPVRWAALASEVRQATRALAAPKVILATLARKATREMWGFEAPRGRLEWWGNKAKVAPMDPVARLVVWGAVAWWAIQVGWDRKALWVWPVSRAPVASVGHLVSRARKATKVNVARVATKVSWASRVRRVARVSAA